MDDDALYKAKRGGRDQICTGNAPAAEIEPLT